MYPWVEQHHTFLHNWNEVNHFISELREEAEETFGPDHAAAERIAANMGPPSTVN